MAGLWDKVRDTVRRVFSAETEDQIAWLLKQAERWKSPDASTYDTETARRREYLQGDMAEDALVLLKAEFPKLWREIKGQQYHYPVTRYIADKRAQVFRGRGSRFYLYDEAKGKELDPDNAYQRTLNYLIESSGIMQTLVEINRALEVCPEMVAKAWWDQDHVEVSPYWMDQAHIAINPDRPWDAQSAYAILFEMAGLEGINDINPRYEVWGTRDPEIADDEDDQGRQIFQPDMHYISTKRESASVNDFDANPFKLRADQARSMYPFTLFRTFKGDVYSRKGGDELVGFNRNFNLNMTWLNHNLHWQMTNVPAFEWDSGQVSKEEMQKLKNTYVNSPRHITAVPAGVKMSFISPKADPAPFRDTFEAGLQMLALLKGLSPKHLDIRGGLPASGIALRIELDGLVRHNAEMTRLIKPSVEDLLERMVVVSNYYLPRERRWARELPAGIVVKWDSGQYDAGPTDYVELGNRYSKECSAGVSSYAHWAMDVHGIKSEKEAQQKVLDNLEFNRRVDEMRSLVPAEPTAAADAEVPAGDEEGAVEPDEKALAGVKELEDFVAEKAK